MLNFRTSAIMIYVDLLFMERIKGWPRLQKGHKGCKQGSLGTARKMEAKRKASQRNCEAFFIRVTF